MLYGTGVEERKNSLVIATAMEEPREWGWD